MRFNSAGTNEPGGGSSEVSRTTSIPSSVDPGHRISHGGVVGTGRTRGSRTSVVVGASVEGATVTGDDGAVVGTAVVDGVDVAGAGVVRADVAGGGAVGADAGAADIGAADVALAPSDGVGLVAGALDAGASVETTWLVDDAVVAGAAVVEGERTPQ